LGDGTEERIKRLDEVGRSVNLPWICMYPSVGYGFYCGNCHELSPVSEALLREVTREQYFKMKGFPKFKVKCIYCGIEQEAELHFEPPSE